MVDNLKLIAGVLLVACGFAGYYWLGDDSAAILRVLAVAGGFVAGGVVAGFSEPGRRFIAYAREAVIETKKVVWPTRKETMQTTAMVFGFVVVMALFLWATDKTLEWVLYDLVLGWKKT